MRRCVYYCMLGTVYAYWRANSFTYMYHSCIYIHVGIPLSLLLSDFYISEFSCTISVYTCT